MERPTVQEVDMSITRLDLLETLEYTESIRHPIMNLTKNRVNFINIGDNGRRGFECRTSEGLRSKPRGRSKRIRGLKDVRQDVNPNA